MPRSISWTKQMDERLVRLNRRAHEVSLEEIAQELGVSSSSVRTRIKRLAVEGIVPPGEVVRVRGRKKGIAPLRRKWTPEKLQQLIDLFGGVRSFEQIGELMGETGVAIRGQVYLLRKAGRLPKGWRGYRRKPRADQGVSRIFSPKQDRLLIRRVKEGRTNGRIAKELGATKNQVRGRVSRLRQLGLLRPYHATVRATRARKRRRLIIRMYRDGCSVKDIAKACGSTPNTICVMLVRLRKKGIVHLRPHPREFKRERAPGNGTASGSSA